MSGASEFYSALVEAGLSEPRIEGVLRYSTAAGLLPRRPRGRPVKGSGDWAAGHYATVLIGLGAINPIDAPSVAGWLGALKHTGSTRHTVVRDEAGEGIAIQQVPDRILDMDLLACLATDIEVLAHRLSAEREALRQTARGLFVRLDVSRLEASVPFQFGDGCWGVDQFGPPKRNQLLMLDPPKLSWGFEVKLEIEIIFIAAELLAETLAKQSGGDVPPEKDLLAGGSVEDGSTTKNENAPDLAGSGAPRDGRNGNQSRLLNASGQSDASEDREAGISAQQRNPASDWVSLTLRKRLRPPCQMSMA